MRVSLSRAGGALALFAFALQACTVGPNYVRPDAPTPAAYKEAATTGGATWTPAQPGDLADRGAWWSVYNDPLLDQLERRIDIGNQNLRASEATYRQAVETLSQTRAEAFPTAGLNGSATRSDSGGGGSSAAAAVAGGARNAFGLSGSASWVPDLWGRVRRSVEESRANAQADAADLAGVRLSAQSALAANYLELRVLDQQRLILDAAVAAYTRSQTVVENRYRAGVVARADLISAQTQVRSAQAAAVDVGVRRGQLEHAIAALIGVTPDQLTIAPLTTAATVEPPEAPTGLPSTLLERRPDIAGAERRMAAANADIGVQTAAYYPSFTLSADGGLNAATIGSLFSAAAGFWSLGGAVAEDVIDFGARRSRVRQARARYDQTVAQYRQTALTAFQGVEDQLVALRVLKAEQAVRIDAEALARRAEALAVNRYRAGLVDFTTVITAQTQALTAEQSTLAVRESRLQASVGLIEAFGGGWRASDLPTPKGKLGFP